MLNGILNIDKPRGMTSHDVVAAVRRLMGLRAVGHTGSLDPDASGVLVLCLGQATKFARVFEELDKSYWVVMRLGICTDTQDATGTPTRQCAVPALNMARVQEVLPQYTGPIAQIPPMYSAVKYRGQRLYRLARQGCIVPREARRVVIHRLQLLDLRGPLVTLGVTCTKGTYIRTLCEDIGLALGYGAHVVHLQRCRVGHFSLRQACSLDLLGRQAQTGQATCLPQPLPEAMAFLPSVSLSAEQYDTWRAEQGRGLATFLHAMTQQPACASWYRLCTPTNQTVAILGRRATTPHTWKVYHLEQDVLQCV